MLSARLINEESTLDNIANSLEILYSILQLNNNPSYFTLQENSYDLNFSAYGAKISSPFCKSLLHNIVNQ